MERQPYFQVGEDCILARGDSHQEVTVLEIFDHECHITGKEGLHKGFYYRVGVVGPNGNDKWVQHALRKKHKPSGNSFRELINNLKCPA